MVRICVAGSLVFDLVVKTQRRPQKGETLKGETFGMFPGGKGANQAVAAARLGAHVWMCGKIGGDIFGKMLLENLKREKVNADNVRTEKNLSSGAASIIVDAQGDNSIVVVPNANMHVRERDVRKFLPAIKKAQAVLLQLEIPVKTVYDIAQIAKKEGKHVVLNPAPAGEIPETLLRFCDVLIPNEQELGTLARTRIRKMSDAVYAAKELVNKGAKDVVVTLGEKGALWLNAHTQKLFKPFSVKTADTTACGDAFCAAFTVARCEGMSMEKSIVFANAAGALTATKMGAQPSLPSRHDVEKFMKHARLALS